MPNLARRVTLVLSGFDPDKPVIVLRPYLDVSTRLLLNVDSTTHELNKLGMEEVTVALGNLHKRFGRLFGYHHNLASLVKEKGLIDLKEASQVEVNAKRISGFVFKAGFRTPKLTYLTL